MLSAGALAVGMFPQEWRFAGAAMTPYDALLMIDAILGLVPSVMRKAQWAPKGL